ncbi:Predicted N-acyltransferase, GNAT family [Halogranum gelatinilyticum]|uniref:Predicted N-acyltransferase, GNAT family n=1 Tax=Halogranum gelatinilyticum TaxID=660521 RepID=A0A1G9VM51_9EURY|nr:GNAT family N-acetyltransferase [Halogranum gelatinilyticum]SDM73111.1 Predicted N-acyltransferase, GNAT family [Halogranum gelatinilyticum]
MTRDGVVVVDNEETRDDAFEVRRAVFVEEQGVPESLEWDEYEDEATHVVAYDEGQPVGAARFRDYDLDGDRVCKVERVAVLESARGEDWGRRLMEVVEGEAEAAGFDRFFLHAQTSAREFYQKLGYEQVGEEFLEADIPHVKMVKSL